MRPEEYCNFHLMEFRRLTGDSPEEVHDARVEIRKYLVVGESLYLLHGDWESLGRARRIASLLGKVRDVDVSGCGGGREELLYRARLIRDGVRPFPRLLGSRLMVMEALLREYTSLKGEAEFHSVRKRLRRARILAEALELDSSGLKKVVRWMGEIRDRWLKETCGKGRLELNTPEELKAEGMKVLREVLLSGHEFHHVREKVRGESSEYERS